MSHIFTTFSPNDLRPKKKRLRILVKIAAILFGVTLLFVIGVFAYLAKDLPGAGGVTDRVVVESTKIYDRTGDHLLYEIHGEEKRTIIPFSDMPESIRYATIALEDQDFYSHRGIKLTSIIRAALKDVLHMGASQGGSTITQQFVKNSILSREKTVTRKIKELILSIEMEQKFSKDEILAMYLNEIPYGSNAYGIQAAAQTYFGKNAKELTLDEVALLASLPQAPSYYSPYGSHLEELKARQEYALKALFNQGYITEDQMNEAKEVDVLAKISPFRENISAPHFVMYVKEYLENKYGEQIVEQGGLKVYTTLDWNKQMAAEKAVAEGAEKNSKTYRANNAALVAMDPKNGQILAMVGSKDYFRESEPKGCVPGKNCVFEPNVNVATRDRQPGSSFKPYVYLTAFTKGYTPETQLFDVDTNFSTDSGTDYNPKNYDGKNHGLLQMKNALAMSLNVPAVKTLYLAGVKESIALAKSLGITGLNQPDRYGLSLVLGGGEVKLVDHVNAFASLANNGTRQEKTSILKIEDNKGSVLEEFKSAAGEKVVDEKYIGMLDYILSTNDLRAPVFGTNNPLSFSDRPVAAKTGTTNEWRDGWTMGYTPSLAVGVWAGNNDNSKMAEGADGIYVAAPIWRSFMDEALKNTNVEQFPKYNKDENKTGKQILDGEIDPLEKTAVCEIKKGKYCLADSDCPDKKSKKKKVFTGHTILWYLDRTNPLGKAPKNPADDPQFKNWEAAVQKWAESQDYTPISEGPSDKCKKEDFSNYQSTSGVSIDSPSDGEIVSTKDFGITVSGSDKIKRISLIIDGKEVNSADGASLSYTYSIPDEKNNSSLEIRATGYNKDGEGSSSSIKVYTAF